MTGEGDESLESSYAFAARFIRAALAFKGDVGGDFSAAILALRCVSPYPEDNCLLYNEGYAVARQEAAALATAPRAAIPAAGSSAEEWKPTQAEADAWADRNGLSIHGQALIVAIEDAASMHMVAAPTATKDRA